MTWMRAGYLVLLLCGSPIAGVACRPGLRGERATEGGLRGPIVLRYGASILLGPRCERLRRAASDRSSELWMLVCG